MIFVANTWHNLKNLVRFSSQMIHTVDDLMQMDKCTRSKTYNGSNAKTATTLKDIDENSTGIEFITAVDDGNGPHLGSQMWHRQHSSTKTNSQLSDTTFSIRNCSSILQNSTNMNHTGRQSISPGDKKAKSLVRQTSTPMIKCAAIIQSPDSLTSSMASQMSSIHSSSNDSDAMVPSPPPMPPQPGTAHNTM